MDGFLNLSEFYDELVGADYPKICDFIINKVRSYCPNAEIGVDLGCGSGSLTAMLAQNGLDMIGIDNSPAMLARAAEKKADPDVLYLLQPMDEIDLSGPADLFVSTLDSVNYLDSARALDRMISRVSLFANPNALFIFDINTKYKYTQLHEKNLIYETDDAVLIWENDFDDPKMYYDLLYFRKAGALYKREEEQQIQTYFDPDMVIELLKKHGFSVLTIEDDYTSRAVSAQTERIVFTAQKENN